MVETKKVPGYRSMRAVTEINKWYIASNCQKSEILSESELEVMMSPDLPFGILFDQLT